MIHFFPLKSNLKLILRIHPPMKRRSYYYYLYSRNYNLIHYFWAHLSRFFFKYVIKRLPETHNNEPLETELFRTCRLWWTHCHCTFNKLVGRKCCIWQRRHLRPGEDSLWMWYESSLLSLVLLFARPLAEIVSGLVALSQAYTNHARNCKRRRLCRPSSNLQEFGLSMLAGNILAQLRG